jgi:alpha-amylase
MFGKKVLKSSLIAVLLCLCLVAGMVSCSNEVATEPDVTDVQTTDLRATSANPKSGVMLQGFNWESASRSDSSTHGKWYSTMLGKASEIKNTFEYVWFPPPSLSASTEGYLPTQLNNFDSTYGTGTELKKVITSISPAKAIADIVINHRCGTSDWGDFTNPAWNDNFYSICADDEGFSGSSVMRASSKRGNYDTGEGYSAGRDIDHTNWDVQNGITSWMNNKLKGLGFVGWRYDFVKGYSGYYVGKYNANTSAEFSVGEYWPSAGFDPNWSQGWKDELMNWVNKTAEGGYKTRVFDFVLKGNLNYAFGYGNESGRWDMRRLADSNNIFRQAPAYAVTFVDNHDTGSTQAHWELDPGDLAPAYAYLLTHPGYPCVAWQHYFTGSGSQYKANNSVQGTGYNLRQHIDHLIKLRKDMGIGYDSAIEVWKAEQNIYVAKITGTKGTVIVKIGGQDYNPGSGYTDNYSGVNFAIWTSSSSSTGTSTGTTTTSSTVKFTNNMNWSPVYAYFFNSKGTVGKAWPGTKMTSMGRNEYNEPVFKVTIPSGATHVIFTNGSKQTVDIKLSGAEGYYLTGSTVLGKYNVGTW